MATHDMKTLLSKLNSFATSVLHNAAGLTVSRTNYEVSVEHFLLKCLEDRASDIPLILGRSNIDLGEFAKALTNSLEDLKTGNASKPVFSPSLINLIQEAWLAATLDLGEGAVRTGAILAAFLDRPGAYSNDPYADMLASIGRDTLVKNFRELVKGSSERATAPSLTGAPGAAPAAEGEGFIAQFCQDFTAKAREGKIDPVFGRDHEIRQIVDILARRRKNNPILVGEPGVGKSAVMEGLARRIAEGDVPDLLKDVTLLNLDMGALEAGAGMKGEFEKRLQGVINEIKASETPIIMFIDEAHTLVGAGGAAGGSDAANLLKPALARGELKTCAATTWSEYKKYFEKDPALARRFQLVKLDEPSVDTSVLILQGLKDSYEATHNVIIQNPAMITAAEYSDRYISARFLPDKAIDLLDTACARVKIMQSAKPGPLEDKERTIQALEREKKTLDRDRTNNVPVDEERYEKITSGIAQATEDVETIKAKWEKELAAAKAVLDIRRQLAELKAENGDQAKTDELKAELDKADAAFAEAKGEEPFVQIDVNQDVVAQVVADWTGIPLGKLLRDQAETVIHLSDKLRDRIKGQDLALDAIAQVIRSAKAGIKNPEQPQGVFLLVGPSGVGKTETGLALADLLFGGERNIVTINMSEFQEAHTVSRLIGSPPGYVGYGEGGLLTEAVRQKPYSVVLLDEVEKAHLDVMELFYQVFDKGRLNDGEGKEINFRNTVMILTSNLGTDVIQEMSGDEPIPLDAVTGAVRPLLSKHFKPALLARMNIVPYMGLNAEALKLIVRLKMNKLKNTLQENNKMTLAYTDEVLDQITERCTETETGARNIDYILNGNVLPQMSRTILERMSEGEMPSKVDLGVNDEGQFTMDFKE